MSGSCRMREVCALCQARQLDDVLTLPATPLANEFVPAARADQPQDEFPLTLMLCRSCGHLQLRELVDPKRLFENYVYVTGTSPVTRAHLAQYAEQTMRMAVTKDPFVVEIGSNDGTLLHEFENRGAHVLGVDPAKAIAKIATDNGVPTLATFFTSKLATEIVSAEGAADIVIANNVFAHAEDLRDIAIGVRTLLGSSRASVFIFEVAHALDIVNDLAFDTIYHEHYSYHTVAPLVRMFKTLGMTIFRVQHNPGQVGRGSLRLYASTGSVPADASVESVTMREMRANIDEARTWKRLKQRIDGLGRGLRESIDEWHDAKKTVMGYGAPAKLTTLMYTFGLRRAHIRHVVDDSTWKQGLFTPGLHIPVVAPTLDRAGDVCIMFAWNFAESIAKKCRAEGWKSAFVLPMEQRQ